MAKPRTEHRCRECGASTARWEGRCPACGAWNTLEAQTAAPRSGRLGAPSASIGLAEIDPSGGMAVPTGIAELDRALSGGLVPGSVTLFSGEPGIGKSTLVLQVASELSRRRRRVLVVSGEESAAQIARRAHRLGADSSAISLGTDVALDAIERMIENERPELCIVDSIQTIADQELGGAAGSVAQVRECAARLAALAKHRSVAMVLVGHVTKDGAIAGPRLLEHLVDTVCSFEGDRHHALRVLSVLKHRFGAAGELGVFEMGDHGLVAVADPSALFLADRRPGVSGSVVVPVLEGRRALLVELQTLVVPTVYGTPRRQSEGVSAGRLALLLAVLEQRAGVSAASLDVFASAVGGVSVSEPAADLALALALASAIANRPVDAHTIALGEVGLAGEVRQVVHAERRLAEAARRGFRRALLPASAPVAPPGMEAVAVETLVDAVDYLSLFSNGDLAASSRR